MTDSDTNGRIILKWRLSKQCKVCIGFIWLRIGTRSWLALVNIVINLWVPENIGHFFIRLGAIGFSKSTLLHRVSVSL
jgi:hypothetical protein